MPSSGYIEKHTLHNLAVFVVTDGKHRIVETFKHLRGGERELIASPVVSAVK